MICKEFSDDLESVESTTSDLFKVEKEAWKVSISQYKF